MKVLYKFKKMVYHSKTMMQKAWVHPKVVEKLKRNNLKLKETKEIYSVGGYKYSTKRHEMHMKIVNEMMKQASSPKKGTKPVAILIGGGSATGKTTMREAIIKKELTKMEIQAVTVDPDEIKEYIPEYEPLKKNDPNHAAHLVYKESCDIRDLLLKRLIASRKHFIYEGTMAKTRKYKKLINKLNKAGYEVHVYIVDVPLELAKQRANERAKITGRTIPPHIIENTHKLVPKTFLAIKDMIDSYHIYDNRNKLILVASNHYIEPKLYDEFLKKGRVR